MIRCTCRSGTPVTEAASFAVMSVVWFAGTEISRIIPNLWKHISHPYALCQWASALVFTPGLSLSGQGQFRKLSPGIPTQDRRSLACERPSDGEGLDISAQQVVGEEPPSGIAQAADVCRGIYRCDQSSHRPSSVE